MVTVDPEGLRILALVVASAGGFATGVILTVLQQSRIVLRVGGRTVPVPRRSVVFASLGASLAVASTTVMAAADPTLLKLGVALAVIVVFLLASWGVVKNGGREA